MPNRSRGPFLLMTALVAGCIPAGDGPVVVTNFSAADRSAIEADWRAAGGTGTIRWVVASAGTDPTRFAGRREGIDAVLGGPPGSHERLAGLAATVAIEPDRPPHWRVARRGGLTWRDPRVEGEPRLPAQSRSEDRLALDDPRHDPGTFRWMADQLEPERWAEGYAGLIRLAGGLSEVGRSRGAALAALERGAADLALIDDPDARPVWAEGVTVLASGGHTEEALALARFLADRLPDSRPDRAGVGNHAAEELLADLLGATLVDALPELRAAWQTLAQTGYPERASRWMTQPPPWPPASIERLRSEGKPPALRTTLAEQIAPDPDARAWLLASWSGPSRPIDGELLTDLGSAADGRLVAEPRFRAWLRGEWTAWARQRFRRVAVNARGAVAAEVETDPDPVSGASPP